MPDEATETVQITNSQDPETEADDQQIGPTDAEIKRLKAQCRGRDLPSAGTSAACALYRQGIIDGTPELDTVLAYIRSAPESDVMNVDGIGPTGYSALEEEAKTETSDAPDAMVPPDPVPRQRYNAEAPKCDECGSGCVISKKMEPKQSPVHPFQASQVVYWRCLKNSDHGPNKTIRKGHVSEFPRLNR